MVHGGGHHGGGSGGGSSSSSWGGTNDSNHWGQSNNKNNNNNNHSTVIAQAHDTGDGGYQNSAWGGYPPPQGDTSRQACCCVGCCAGVAIETDIVQHDVPKRSSCPPMLPYILVSALVFIIVMITSNVDDNWTLNPEETRKIHVGGLNRELHVRSNLANGFQLYAIDGACPALTGPKLELHEVNKIELAEGDYQYDYFYLNQGSYLDVSLFQEDGSSNVLLLRGLKMSELTDDYDASRFDVQSILKRYAGMGQTAELQYTAPESDTYVVIYDNASNSNGKATVTYHVDLTSFDLRDKSPVSCETTTRCSVKVIGLRDCILLQANDLVTIQLSASRIWHMIALWVALPVVMGYCCIKPKERQQTCDNPPPTNPGATVPSAPPYQMVPSGDEHVYVVPAEHVLPVATLHKR